MAKESYTPEPRKPRLIWSGRDRRKVAEPLPSQVVEIVFPQHAQVKDLRAWQELRREQAEQARLPGMRPATRVGLGPADPATALPANRLIWTNDNLVALTSLLQGDDQHPPLEGKVDLIYIDPPFAVQSNFRINIEIDNGAVDEKLPTLIEELAYTDTWRDGLDSYLSMMRDRLEMLKQLLAPTGSIYVHCDWHAGHYIKVLMDEVFGYDNFRNEIVWKRDAAGKGAKRVSGQWPRNADSLLYYSKSGETWSFQQQYRALSAEQRKTYRYTDESGRRFKAVQLGDYSAKSIERMDQEGLIYRSSTGKMYKKYYVDEVADTVDCIWDDVMGFGVRTAATEHAGFPTQKPVALLQRIIAASSNPGDLVLDAFAGSGTTAVAAETMQDAEGKLAPRRWIAMDCGKFAIHLTRKRLIEAGAQPFSVENIGFYARGAEWRDLWAEQPAAKVYRDAMVEIYGGTPVEGYAHLHGRKGQRWVHIGPIDAPVAPAQVDAVLAEAATTEIRAVDILSADIPIDWNRSDAEERWGIRVYAKTIPAAAVDAVRDRLARKRRKDAALAAEPDPPIHFFSPPDVEVSVSVSGDSATVKLLRLTVDLDDCLSTQDPAKRAQIRERITDWRALIDYWAVDWDYRAGEPFQNDWQSFRTRKTKKIAMQASNSYGANRGEKVVAVKVTDIFGNDGLKVARVLLS